MFFLNATNPQTIKLARTAMIDVGFKAQRLGNDVLKKFAKKQTAQPPATVGKPPVTRAGDPLHQQEDAGQPAEEDGARAARHRGQQDTCRSSATRRRPPPIPRRCSTSRAAARSGCSRRSAWRRRRCCGTPACRRCCRRAICAAAIRSAASGQFDKAEKIITDNRVLFHRVANTLNYLDIKTVVVSLRHLLRPAAGLRVREDLPGLPDHRHPRVPAREGHHAGRRERHALHVPRPVPHADEDAGPGQDGQRADGLGERRLQDREERSLLRRIGTLGVTRPDISTQVRFRKEEEMRKGAAKLRGIPLVAEPARTRQSGERVRRVAARAERLACSRPATARSRTAPPTSRS